MILIVMSTNGSLTCLQPRRATRGCQLFEILCYLDATPLQTYQHKIDSVACKGLGFLYMALQLKIRTFEPPMRTVSSSDFDEV